MNAELAVVGTGVPTGFSAAAEGTLCEVNRPSDAVALLTRLDDGTARDLIVLVHEAGGTTIGPLLGDIAGIVSTTGTLGAHIALLAKEYDCPCIVGAELSVPLDELGRVRMEADGKIRALPGEDQ